jgi:hypothetical protein
MIKKAILRNGKILLLLAKNIATLSFNDSQGIGASITF